MSTDHGLFLLVVHAHVLSTLALPNLTFKTETLFVVSITLSKAARRNKLIFESWKTSLHLANHLCTQDKVKEGGWEIANAWEKHKLLTWQKEQLKLKNQDKFQIKPKKNLSDLWELCTKLSVFFYFLIIYVAYCGRNTFFVILYDIKKSWCIFWAAKFGNTVAHPKIIPNR